MQSTVEFEPGVVFTTERSPRVDQLIADGRLEIVDEEVTIKDGDPMTIDDLHFGEKYGSADEQPESLVGSYTESDAAPDETKWDVTVGDDTSADTVAIDDTPPAATEPEPEPRKNSRARKPKEDTE